MSEPDLIERCTACIRECPLPNPENVVRAILAEFLAAIREPAMVEKIAARYGNVIGLPWITLPEQSSDSPCRHDLRRVIRHAMLAMSREVVGEAKQ